MDFLRQRPSLTALAWVERTLGSGFRVRAWRRMTGGITSAVHRLTVERAGTRRSVVLRQYRRADAEAQDSIEREAAVLRLAAQAGLTAPEVLGSSASGADAGGHPSLLMSRLPGRMNLGPRDPRDWLEQIATTAARIHNTSIAAPGAASLPAFQDWIDTAQRSAPASSSRPALWKAAFEALQARTGATEDRFIHGDFQHFNLLWSRGRLSGVVDWVWAARGPPDVDVGHCRLNLTVLFGPDWAERFRLVYEAETGRSLDPWWDLYGLLEYNDAWRQFIPIQVDGRTDVDVTGMTVRVEELVEATLRRL